MTRLVFTTSDDLFSLGVRMLTFSDVAHVAIGLGNRGDRLLHATLKGVVVQPRKTWRQRTVADFEIVPNVLRGLIRCGAQLGKPYDDAEVALRPFLAMLQYISPFAPRSGASPTAWSCARFVMLLDPGGYQIPEWRDLDPLTATPADLFGRCLGGQSFRRVGSPM